MSNTNDYLPQNILEEQSVYEMLSYLPYDLIEINEDLTIDEIIFRAKEYHEKELQDKTGKELTQFELDVITATEAILKSRSELGENTIANMSWSDKTDDGIGGHPLNGMQACTFHNNETGETFITIRGTPSGAWIDNGKMMIGDLAHCRTTTDINGKEWNYLSPMQAEALDYMNSLLNKYGDDWLESDSKQYLVGHSKGGNPVQILTLMYSDYVEYGLSFDGPGLSKELYHELLDNLDEEQIQEALNKLYAIHGSNDFVHRMGYQVVLPEHTRWIEENQSYGSFVEIFGCHFPFVFINPVSGTLAPFTDGPGPVSEFVRSVSEIAMDLPTEDREAVFLTMMLLLQLGYVGEYPVNSEDERWAGIIANLDNGSDEALGIILSVLLTTEEGSALIEHLDELGIIDKIKAVVHDKSKFLKNPLLRGVTMRTFARLMILLQVLVKAAPRVMDIMELRQIMEDVQIDRLSMGEALFRACVLMVNPVLEGYKKGLGLSTGRIKTGFNMISRLFTWDAYAENGKIGIIYNNIATISDIISSANEVYYPTIYIKFQHTLDKLHSMKFWKTDTVPLMLCMQDLERYNFKLSEYREYLNLYSGKLKKAEEGFIEHLNQA